MRSKTEAILILSTLEPDQWAALGLLIKECYDNADNVLHSATCENREFYAGKCAGINELINIENVVDEESNRLRKEIDERSKRNQ